MAATLRIQLLDGAGPGAYTGSARVSLVPKAAANGAAWPFEALAATHTPAADGVYLGAGDPEPGEWLLAVNAAGRSPVVQRLRFSVAGDLLRAVPGWQGESSGNAALAACVGIHGRDVRAKADAQRQAAGVLLSVHLYPRREAVLMASTDAGGNHFILFAEDRRQTLHAQNRLDDGSVTTLISTQDRFRLRTVRARGRGFVVVERKDQPPKSKGPYTGDPATDLGILDLYRHLHGIGATHPGTVVEVGIFGHAWMSGPVIWNTYDYSPDPLVRDAEDLDGRYKDWNPKGQIVHGTFSKLPRALAKDGMFKVWGCNATASTLASAVEGLAQLDKGTPADRFFDVRWGDGAYRGAQRATLETIRWQMYRELTRGSFNAAAARSLPCRCFGAPPGMGATYGKSRRIMSIDRTVPQYRKAYAYYDRVFDMNESVIDEHGYVDFKAFDVSEPKRPAFRTERWMSDAFGGRHRFLILPIAYCVLWPGPGKWATVTAAHDLRVPGHKGHLYAIPDARPVRLVQALNKQNTLMNWVVSLDDATGHDVGFWIEEGGGAYILTRTKGGPWKLHDAELPFVSGILRVKHPEGAHFTDVTPIGAMKAGVVYEGPPEYRW